MVWSITNSPFEFKRKQFGLAATITCKNKYWGIHCCSRGFWATSKWENDECWICSCHVGGGGGGNCNLGQQQIILRHLVFYFGQWFTVPEQKLRELQEGTLLPITDSVEIEGEIIQFWYKTLQEVVLPCQAWYAAKHWYFFYAIWFHWCSYRWESRERKFRMVNTSHSWYCHVHVMWAKERIFSSKFLSQKLGYQLLI